jgi:hypothetical protein
MITIKTLDELLTYIKETGEFTWNKTVCSKAPKGSFAGCLDSSKGYYFITLNKVRYLRAELVILAEEKEYYSGCIEHKDRIRSNDVYTNLKKVSGKGEGNKNRAIQTNNSSGTTGVYFSKSEGKWKSYITMNRQTKGLGTFKTKEEAVKARLEANNLYGFTGEVNL